MKTKTQYLNKTLTSVNEESRPHPALSTSGEGFDGFGIANIQWTVDGKVKAVNGSATQLAKYVYDATGNRVMKQTPVMNTIYARDANSQVMAIYESIHLEQNNSSADPSVTPCIDIVFNQNLQTVVCPYEYKICGNYTYDVETGEITLNQDVTSEPIISGPCYGTFHTLVNGTKIQIDTRQLYGPSSTMSLLSINDNVESGTVSTNLTITNPSSMPKLSEWHIYGNEQQGRFSVRKPDADPLYYLDVLKSDVTKKNFFRILDKKQYELKDHLGNVRVAIGDMKIPSGNSFVVDEKSVSDFYPGGMSISDRSWQGTSYRYGYNAQEKSLEIDASGNHHTAEFWEVDNARLGRWNRDPKPVFGISEYSVFGGNPILYNDLNGDSVESDQETFDDANEGFKAIFNDKNPFIFDQKTRTWGIDPSFDLNKAKFDDIQLNTYMRVAESINSSDWTLAQSVDFKGPIITIKDGVEKENTLENKNAAGTTVSYEKLTGKKYLGKFSYLVYLAKNIPDESIGDKEIGLTAIHEFGGHLYLHLIKSLLKPDEHSIDVEKFENDVRKIYKSKKTNQIIGGQGSKHKRVGEKK